jgi:hypothetical protein
MLADQRQVVDKLAEHQHLVAVVQQAQQQVREGRQLAAGQPSSGATRFGLQQARRSFMISARIWIDFFSAGPSTWPAFPARRGAAIRTAPFLRPTGPLPA